MWLVFKNLFVVFIVNTIVIWWFDHPIFSLSSVPFFANILLMVLLYLGTTLSALFFRLTGAFMFIFLFIACNAIALGANYYFARWADHGISRPEKIITENANVSIGFKPYINVNGNLYATITNPTDHYLSRATVSCKLFYESGIATKTVWEKNITPRDTIDSRFLSPNNSANILLYNGFKIDQMRADITKTECSITKAIYTMKDDFDLTIKGYEHARLGYPMFEITNNGDFAIRNIILVCTYNDGKTINLQAQEWNVASDFQKTDLNAKETRTFFNKKIDYRRGIPSCKLLTANKAV